jgi:hypothetical protein
LQYRNTFTRLDNRANGATIDFATGASLTESASFSSTQNIFNDGGVDMDFRVESDSNTHALFMDASTSRTHINGSTDYASVSGVLNVHGTDNNITLNVVSTDSDAGTGPSIQLLRATASPADGDITGEIRWRSSDSVGNSNTMSIIRVITDDVTDGSEDGRLQLMPVINDTATSGIEMSASGVVVNESSANLDFRVESDSNTHALFVDASANQVMIGASSGTGVYNGTGSAGVVIDGVSGSSNNITHMINNYGNANMYLSKKAGFTNGNLIYMMVNGANTGSIQTTTSGVTYNTTSDRRLKTDIQPIANGTDMLMAMNPVTHGWKSDPHTGETVHGFIAQEMQDIVPEAVSGEPDGEEMMSMDYGRITPVLVAALQEAHNKIEALEERLAELEAK